MKILTKKEQKKVCNAIVANTIMAFNLLDLDDPNPKRTIEYTEHLIDNTMGAVLSVGGWNAMIEAKEVICRYQKSIETKHLKEYTRYTELLAAVDQRPRDIMSITQEENEHEG